MDPIQSTVKSFILEEFLPTANPSELTATTPLISGGILDSLATIRLVAFLEEQFGITLAPHEAGLDYLDTLDQIGALVQRKRSAPQAR
jgi:acyl carrier protein